MSDTKYYCEPAWHNRAKVDANYLILAHESERNALSNAFACCDAHTSNALDMMLGRFKRVVVRRVSNTDPSGQARKRVE